MTRKNFLHFDATTSKQFVKNYNSAVLNGSADFNFQNAVIVTEYGFYLIQYLLLSGAFNGHFEDNRTFTIAINPIDN